MDDTPFHRGEVLVQQRTGERAKALINGRIISPRIPAAARSFVGQQQWCVIGATDRSGAVHASLLTGEAGFVRASEELDRMCLALDDPYGHLATTAPLHDLQAGQCVGVLLIELQTRRRLRVNGQVTLVSANRLEVDVAQAFPACPRYIQKRQPEPAAPIEEESAAVSTAGSAVEAAVAAWIDSADTLFIATLGPAGEADVSHRGGRPGFVQRDGQLLRIPDYNGNSMFNTLGNLEVESRCGLVLPDFDGARQLQLTGHARVSYDVVDGVEDTGGTGRWIEFTVDRWSITPLNLPLRWRFVEASPHNL